MNVLVLPICIFCRLLIADVIPGLQRSAILPLSSSSCQHDNYIPREIGEAIGSLRIRPKGEIGHTNLDRERERRPVVVRTVVPSGARGRDGDIDNIRARAQSIEDDFLYISIHTAKQKVKRPYRHCQCELTRGRKNILKHVV